MQNEQPVDKNTWEAERRRINETPSLLICRQVPFEEAFLADAKEIKARSRAYINGVTDSAKAIKKRHNIRIYISSSDDEVFQRHCKGKGIYFSGVHVDSESFSLELLKEIHSGGNDAVAEYMFS